MTALLDRADSNAPPTEAVRAPEPAFTIREATLQDNEQLIALSAACAMVGDISLRIDRGPDFFALNRLEGERWRLGVAESGRRVVGCVAVSERKAFVNGREMRTGYVGDLKVHPDYRDTRIADALSHYAERGCAELPPAAPVMITVLSGNRAMERRLSGPRGVSAFRRIGTIRTHSIPVLWRRGTAKSGNVQIERARWSDLDPMVKLWGNVAPGRQLAPAFNADRLAHWIRSAPGLDIDSYRVARSANGEMLGFLAAWDQRSFKQLTVVGYSQRMKTARAAFNVLATVIGSQRMPQRGFALNCVTVAHTCVSLDRPDVLRALLTSTYNELRDTDCSILNIGLDTRDPLSAALEGFFGQPTDVNAYVVTTRRGVLPEFLDARPLHYEIALV